jgi:4'-phosphopantetheinyl transferase EntD
VDARLTEAHLGALMPPGVAVATARDPSAAGPIHPGERAALGPAGPARVIEFAVGRTCARRALHMLGLPAGEIGIGPVREPLWPHGVVGSITHCPGFWAAAVGSPRAGLRALGLDAALNQPLEPDVCRLIAATPGEIAWMEHSTADLRAPMLLFSIKEAVFKAWWPLRRTWLEVADVHVTIDAPASAFSALVHGGRATPETICGRFVADPELVVSLAAVPLLGRAAPPRQLGAIRPA